jgi:hypothetical protein
MEDLVTSFQRAGNVQISRISTKTVRIYILEQTTAHINNEDVFHFPKTLTFSTARVRWMYGMWELMQMWRMKHGIFLTR